MSEADTLDPDQSLPPETVAELTTVLSKALRALGKAGYPVQASKLGGRAWWLLNERCPREAERINGMMHYLAKLPEEDRDHDSVTGGPPSSPTERTRT